MSKNKLESIKADPSKRFFIEMLTKDIKLVDCILDLVDNSVDSVMHKSNFDPMAGLLHKNKKALSGFKIKIIFDKNEFIIEDNSSGVDRDTIFNRAFRFGADKSYEKGYGLSVYGIGMKRSFLKMGKYIHFLSVNKDGRSEVKIDVAKWVKEEEWDFEGSYDQMKSKDTGTKIKITKLNKNIAAIFENKNLFQKRLLDKVGEAYGIFLDNGLKIEINGTAASADIPVVSQSKDLKPSVETFAKDGVKVKLIAGLTPDDEKKANGWYVFCNGRMILSGDKTEQTGWGDGLRKFHPSTNRFVGFVLFESKDVSLLPWATTKDGVDFESVIWRYTLNEMVKIARPVVAMLVSQYQTDKNMQKINNIMLNSKNTPIEELPANLAFKVNFGSENRIKKERILYEVPKEDVDKIRRIVGSKRITNEEIGKKTFYYFLEMESE